MEAGTGAQSEGLYYGFVHCIFHGQLGPVPYSNAAPALTLQGNSNGTAIIQEEKSSTKTYTERVSLDLYIYV